MSRKYRTVDVFTDQMFGGNPLAVVLEAADLDTAAMQRIAREFNYSETTFVLPPADPAHHARIRIFTPGQELPFAGHPNVGTAFVLALERDAPPPERFLFEEGAGLVPVQLLAGPDGRVVGAELTAPEPFRRLGTHDAVAIAAALGLDAGAVRTDRHPPTAISVGLPFIAVELGSRAALARADGRSLGPMLVREAGIAGLLAYTREVAATETGTDLQARMFAPHDGIPEDPATGSACVALGALQADLLPAPDATLALAIGQGVDMGRPSRLEVRAVKRGGAVRSAHVGGRCVAVMEGRLCDPS